MNRRRPLSVLAPLTACLVLGAGLSACGDDEPEAGPSQPGETSSSSESSGSSETADPSQPTEATPTSSGATDEPVAPGEPTAPGGGTSTPAPDVPADAQPLCDVFTTAYQAFVANAQSVTDDDDARLPAALVQAFQDWGQGLREVELPDGFSDDQRAGVQVMSRLLLAIPDDARVADFDDLEDDLSDSEDVQVEAVTDYVDDTCGLDSF